MSSKLTIKEEMNAIDCRKVGWYDSLSDEESKKLSMWVLMRYVSACDTNVDVIRDHYLIMTNELVNVNFNTVRHHPQLQHRLLQVVGVGTPQYHPWIPPTKREKKNKLADWLIDMYPHMNDDEIDIMISQNDTNDFKELAAECGLSDKEIKLLLK